jgi:hypothetical protein
LLIAEDALTYCLVALAEHLIYVIYSVGCVTMGLSFFYLPDLLPVHFIPHYTKGTPFHQLLFYQERQPTTHEQKWKSAEEPNPEALTAMYTAPLHLPHMPKLMSTLPLHTAHLTLPICEPQLLFMHKLIS